MSPNPEVVKFVESFRAFTGNRDRVAPAVALCMSEHRTIQQNMMRFCVAFIEEMANQGFDGRNQESVLLARKIVENTDAFDRYLPYI